MMASHDPVPFLDRRRAGVLLHPTSLPGIGGNGTLGPEAYQFVNWLASAGFTVWQMLPLGPTHSGGSPYQCFSAHAGNATLISTEKLVDQGWLRTEDVQALSPRAALEMAFANWRAGRGAQPIAEYQRFLSENSYWLWDYALYAALRVQQNFACWVDWPAALRDRETRALDEVRHTLADAISLVEFEQFVFFSQWHELKNYANRKGVALFGDMPIFVAYDSADVWAQRSFFLLDQLGRTTVVAGVPPDYFSTTGQRWGNPLYDWPKLAADGFKWWLERFHTQLKLFDLIRIDHFRGFEAYWAIDAGCPTAVDGHWVKAPGEEFFSAIAKSLGKLPLVAEDLGVITPEVDALRANYGLPGMKILQFAFDGGPTNPYLPHHHNENSVAYTGTHDNDTTCGWYEGLNNDAKSYVRAYLNETASPMPWPLINACLMSVARLAVLPMQDALSLGSPHRMNTPGTTQGNWQWRFVWDQVAPELAVRMRRAIEMYGRL